MFFADKELCDSLVHHHANIPFLFAESVLDPRRTVAE
jgi:hypothetical protein